MSFPNYNTRIGRCLRAYLNSRICLNPYSAHLLYAANKWESAVEINAKVRNGIDLILNRYRASNIAYGSAHQIPIGWLTGLEEGLPDEDLVIILDVSPALSFKRKNQYRDIHERDRAYLAKVRESYLELAKKFNWHVIDGEKDARTVHSAIWRLAVPLINKQ